MKDITLCHPRLQVLAANMVEECRKQGLAVKIGETLRTRAGQICPQFSFLWLWISLAGIVLDDWLRYWLFGEERPRYRLV